MSTGGFCYPGRLRVRSRADYDRIFQKGRRAGSSALLVVALENDLGYSRFAVSTGRKFGRAPVRNRARRLLREAFRLQRDAVPAGFDFIAVPRAPLFPDRLDQVAPLLLAQAERAAAASRK
jgi:ribonuclease P protein component